MQNECFSSFLRDIILELNEIVFTKQNYISLESLSRLKTIHHNLKSRLSFQDKSFQYIPKNLSKNRLIVLENNRFREFLSDAWIHLQMLECLSKSFEQLTHNDQRILTLVLDEMWSVICLIESQVETQKVF